MNRKFLHLIINTITIILLTVRKLIILIVFFFTSLLLNQAVAQKQGQVLVDSLQTVLKTAREDTEKINTLDLFANQILPSNADSSILLGKQALQLAEKINWQIGIGKAHHFLGVYHNYIRDSVLAIEHSFKALAIYDQCEKSALNLNQVRNLKLKTLISIGACYYGQNNLSKSLYYYLKAYDLELTLKDTTYQPNTLFNIGSLYTDMTDYPKALDYHFKALIIDEIKGDKQGQAIVLGSIALAYSGFDNAKALEYYFKTLKIGEQINDKYINSIAYNNIGNIYEHQKDYPKALEYHFKSLKLSKELGMKDGGVNNLCDIGLVYAGQGDYLKALDYYFKALKILEKSGDKSGTATILSNIGSVYKEQGDYVKALDYLFMSLKLQKELGEKPELNLVLIGRIYIAQNKLKDAEKFLHEALMLSTQGKSFYMIRNVSESLSEMYSKEGNLKKAFDYYKQSVSARDSLYSEERAKKQTRVEMNYEFDKKETATKAEQEKKNALSLAEIKRQTLMKNGILGGVCIAGLFSFLLVLSFNRRKKTGFEKQVSEVETKALRAQMNPHFIFNSLNSIDYYINKNDIKTSSIYVNKFSRLMRLILESSRKDLVPLKEDLEILDLYIQIENLRMENKVEYALEIASEIDPEQALVPPLMMQPFIENAFKHAFGDIEKPKLEIKVSLKNNLIHCVVADNGKGRESKQTIELQTKEKRESLGLKVTQERLDIMNKIRKSKGFIIFEDMKDFNQKALGTKVELAVPASFAF